MEDKSNGVPSTPSSEGAVQVEGKEDKAGEASSTPKNSQKYSKNTWRLLKAEFQAGSYLSLTALAKKYGVHYKTLSTRMVREKWNQQQRDLQSKVEETIQATVVKEVSQTTAYLQNAFKRSQKYEALIDKSIAQNEDILPPGDIDAYTRSELRIHELAKSALRIIPVSQVDHTSGGMDVVTIIGAIAKLRESKGTPQLQDGDVDRILEAGVE